VDEIAKGGVDRTGKSASFDRQRRYRRRSAMAKASVDIVSGDGRCAKRVRIAVVNVCARRERGFSTASTLELSRAEGVGLNDGMDSSRRGIGIEVPV
jgi:hypothetical protein